MPLNGNKRKAHPPLPFRCHNALNAVFIPPPGKCPGRREKVEGEGINSSLLSSDRTKPTKFTYLRAGFFSSPNHSPRITVLRLIVCRASTRALSNFLDPRRGSSSFAFLPVTQSHTAHKRAANNSRATVHYHIFLSRKVGSLWRNATSFCNTRLVAFDYKLPRALITRADK